MDHPMDHPIAVIGGTGRTGRLVARRLTERGERVRVLSRRPPRLPGHLPPGAVHHRADVRDPASLRGPLAGCSALVYCVEPGTENEGPDRPETTMYLGVRNALEAATSAGERPRVVLVSQIHTTHLGHPLNAYGRLLDWRRAGEEAVRASGLPYTVVRPGWLTEERPAGEGIRLVQGDAGTGTVSRPDLAEACVQALACPSADGITFELFNSSGAAPWQPGDSTSAWELAFAALDWDLERVA
ncbi:SDR family oxidoreductase [Streptomyces sp. NPDC096205]|uniref:SDR family oxidoreductase n=1 Tax=Streptomyces sp. NPDC096205 TaxID=3366081 RepID=UPI00382C2CAC